ncbi:DUF418 domain-containing protein [Cytobacillus purgationiresistens]|uniref:DUF418 domain-containing protein n=1 Tax=Cytobacillus purgationiresistens TaxID=863449 RepID=A0ABU0AD32_9BACI|nr:DUF418 domain-containing protein [Cytobacillus purgationiresistens]MDQ0268789.1 uncharacterized protein [Cytobacillus purgationiresistens]
MYPISDQSRITSIDIMRGFALLGIFLVNMLSFHSPFIYIDPFTWWNDGTDRTVFMLIDVFVQASFYPLFALLFGYGVMILRERVILKGLSFPLIVFRRFSFLLVIGLLHAFFIWHGDILVTYALLGFIFILFVKMSAKNLIIIGIVIYTLPNILLSLLLILATLIEPESGMTPFVNVQSYMDTYQNGSFAEITSQRIADWYFTNNLGTFPILAISILPLFLIGGGVQKLKLLENMENHKKLIQMLAAFSLIIGLMFKSLPYLWDENMAAQYIQDIFGGPLVAIGYGLSIALLANQRSMKKILSPLTYVGRLSLSNYLFQSIVSSLIFYGYGLGFYGEISVLYGTLMVAVIFIIQILFSRLWLQYYYYGPFEWLWRSFTYFHLPRMKRML